MRLILVFLLVAYSKEALPFKHRRELKINTSADEAPERPITCPGSCHNQQGYFTFSYEAYSTHYAYAYYGDNVRIHCYPEDAECMAESRKRIRETWMLVVVLSVFVCCCLVLGCMSLPKEELCGRAKAFLPGRF